jgi:phenylalanyl-tRNA synthetase beta chain
MKISYNWLKWYIPEIPEAEKLQDVFTYHLCEVEGIEKKGDDIVFDINILPNRAHDLLSHLGVARELASLLNIEFKKDGPWGNSLKDRPLEEPTNLKIKIETDKCRRYMGRIVRNIKIGPSPDWVIKHLESIGQRSINNIVDATNIVMYDCGQPCHAFDLDKLFSRTVLGDSKKDSPLLLIRQAKEGEKMTTLDDKEVELSSIDMVIADEKNILAIAGVKGGKLAEVDENTKNILIEVANFDPVSVRKTSKKINVLTDSSKRFENDLSPEVVAYAMREISGLLVEYGKFDFEEIVDIYPNRQKTKTLSFSSDKISKILGVNISEKEIEDVLKRYNFEHRPLPNLPLTKGEEKEGGFEIIIPPTRLDLEIEEDMAEEIGRILGYDKIKEKLPEINWKPKINETYAKISWARNKLLNEGYSEVMTYTFCNKGELEVLASASDKKFLRMNLIDGLKESLKLNQLNAPLLKMEEIKIFEIGTVFLKDKEEMHIAYADKKEIKEMSLEEFVPQGQSLKEFPQGLSFKEQKFKPWSSFPFISRDIAVWVPEEVESNQVYKVIKENAGNMVIRGPELFDEFKKDGKISYAFRLVFQSYDCTLTDTEINEIMTKITNKIKEKNGWQVR